MASDFTITDEHFIHDLDEFGIPYTIYRFMAIMKSDPSKSVYLDFLYPEFADMDELKKDIMNQIPLAFAKHYGDKTNSWQSA